MTGLDSLLRSLSYILSFLRGSQVGACVRQLEKGFREHVLEQHLSSSGACEVPNSECAEFSVVRQPTPTDVLSRCKTREETVL